MDKNREHLEYLWHTYDLSFGLKGTNDNSFHEMYDKELREID